MTDKNKKKFYANQAKVPTIAHPKIKFKFRFNVVRETPRNYSDTTYVQEYSNAGYATSIPLFSFNSYQAATIRRQRGREWETDILWEQYTDVKLLDSPDYKLMGITTKNI